MVLFFVFVIFYWGDFMKWIFQNKVKILAVVYAWLIVFGVWQSFLSKSVETFSMPVARKNIVIDAGHGGWDPGKVRSDGIEEKNINLAIGIKLQKYLEQAGANVFTTRIDDSALSKKKIEDLKQRKIIASGEDIDIFVSVHQNSFPKNSVKGAQVFYYKNSESGKALAECIQKKIKEFADLENERIPKANGEYYILKNTKAASVIVECGFLSNEDENVKLNSEEYQQKIAWAIYMGIAEYCKNGDLL